MRQPLTITVPIAKWPGGKWVRATGFFFVTLAEALPIAVITRFIGRFHDFGIPVGGVIANMLIDRSKVTADSPKFLDNRLDMRACYMEDIWENFDGMVRSTVPLYETEVRGTASLTRMGEALFAGAGVCCVNGI